MHSLLYYICNKVYNAYLKEELISLPSCKKESKKMVFTEYWW